MPTVRSGEQVEAFRDLYSSTFRQLLSYCLRRARSPSDADDAVAETYLVMAETR